MCVCVCMCVCLCVCVCRWSIRAPTQRHTSPSYPHRSCEATGSKSERFTVMGRMHITRADSVHSWVLKNHHLFLFGSIIIPIPYNLYSIDNISIQSFTKWFRNTVEKYCRNRTFDLFMILSWSPRDYPLWIFFIRHTSRVIKIHGGPVVNR